MSNMIPCEICQTRHLKSKVAEIRICHQCRLDRINEIDDTIDHLQQEKKTLKANV